MYSWRIIRDKLFIAVVVALSVLPMFLVIHVVYTVVANGISVLEKAGIKFLVETPPPPVAIRIGGIAPSIIGSFLVVLISLPITTAISLPLAILYIEFPYNPLTKLIDVVGRSFASIPTIIVSMVIYLLIVVPMGKPSIIAAALALSIVSIPYAYTVFSTVLSQVPSIYREAAFGTGLNRFQTVIRVVLPIAKKGLLTGVLLTFARSMGETAALLFTIGGFRDYVTLNPTEPSDALPLLIFQFASTPFRIYHEIAWGACFVLLVIYLLVFTVTKVLAREVKL